MYCQLIDHLDIFIIHPAESNLISEDYMSDDILRIEQYSNFYKLPSLRYTPVNNALLQKYIFCFSFPQLIVWATFSKQWIPFCYKKSCPDLLSGQLFMCFVWLNGYTILRREPLRVPMLRQRVSDRSARIR